MKHASKNSAFRYTDIIHENDGTFTVGGITGVPDISKSDIGRIAAWFLGPKAENRDIFKEMIERALNTAVDYRVGFESEDPLVISDTIKKSSSYSEAVDNMMAAYSSLLEFLQKYTTPYFSMRYQAHMLWDNTLPALAAYFATMLHNPNNVTIQASSATTPLEILVGWDLCGMIGFPVRKAKTRREYNPWGHLTCDGTVANIEALWTGREMKFFPFAVRRMLETLPAFSIAGEDGKRIDIPIDNQRCTVTLTSSTGQILELTGTKVGSWQLFNIPMDEILSLPGRIAALYGIEDEFEIWSAVVPYTLNYTGWVHMAAYIRQQWPETEMPVLLAPSTMHYSLPKAAALLGYGFGAQGRDGFLSGGALVNIPVDAAARMDRGELEDVLEKCLSRKIPVAQIIAVAGSTEEGAVDPIAAIIQRRKDFRQQGLEYFVHADAAWGGYVITGMRKPYTLGQSLEAAEKNPDLPPYRAADLFVKPSDSPVNEYVYEQFSSLRKCDSVTIDPHKMGYVQYPAGSVLYRNGVQRRLTTFTGAYIGGTGSVNPGKEPAVGIFGVEGSKPGASAAAVFMNHRVIRPDISGHGKIIRQCLENTRLFALYLMALSKRSKRFRVVLLCSGKDDAKALEKYDPFEMSWNGIHAALGTEEIRNFGPDLNILDYVFVPKGRGDASLSVEEVNAFNTAVYNRFHVPVSPAESSSVVPVPIEQFPRYFLTRTVFTAQVYGQDFLENFLKYILPGVANSQMVACDELVCLRSVIMDPFMVYAENGDFFKTILAHIDETVSQLVEHWTMM